MSMTEEDRERFAAFLLRMRGQGFTERDLITAIEATPRRLFVPDQWQDQAWSDRMVPIACGEAIEGLDLQAKVIASLGLQPGHRVLEIGTGSGFTAAVMGRLAAKVLSIDRYKTLVADARRRCDDLGLRNVIFKQADGSAGMAADGPFDRIVVWACFEEMPRSLVDQLATGGRMVAAIGPAEDVQLMARLSKVGSRFEREDIAHVRLQPLANGMARAI